jgi:hypothetical protein
LLEGPVFRLENNSILYINSAVTAEQYSSMTLEKLSKSLNMLYDVKKCRNADAAQRFRPASLFFFQTVGPVSSFLPPCWLPVQVFSDPVGNQRNSMENILNGRLFSLLPRKLFFFFVQEKHHSELNYIAVHFCMNTYKPTFGIGTFYFPSKMSGGVG